MDIEEEIRFFDRFEAVHGEYSVLAESSYTRILDTFGTILRPRARMTCVDLGCGTGAFTRRLRRFDLDLTGVDVSPLSIARARTMGGAVYVVGDICDCPLLTETYDFVVMSGVLHHMPNPATRIQSLREAFRLLKPGGRFASYDPNAASPSMFLYRDPRSPLYSSEGKTENEVLLGRDEIVSNLAAAGFVETRATGLSGIAYRYVEGRIARQLLPLYNRVYEPLIRWSPFEKALGTFVVASGSKPEPAVGGHLAR